MGGGGVGECSLMALVIFLNKPTEHTTVIAHHFRIPVTFEEQEIAVPVNRNRFCTLAIKSWWYTLNR